MQRVTTKEVDVARLHQNVIAALNRDSVEEMGWSPSWFNLAPDDFGPTLTAEVENFQRSSLGPAIDDLEFLPGVVGWATFLRLQDANAMPAFEVEGVSETGTILFGGERLRVPFKTADMLIKKPYWRCPRKVTSNGKTRRCNSRAYDQPGKCRKCGTTRKKGRRFAQRKHGAKPKHAVWHWPVGEDAKGTFGALSRKGISSHGEITWNGVVVNFADWINNCWHAGSSADNAGLGFDVQLNPVIGSKIPARQKSLVKSGRPERPVIEGVSVRGWKPGPFLYYYDEQLDAVAAVRAACHVHMGMPLTSPWDKGAKRFGTSHTSSQVRKASGHMNHSDVQGGKWDACISDATPIESMGKTVLERAREYVTQGW
jgi:hypothetical protein